MPNTRIESLSILTETGEGKAYLAEVYSGVIENEFSEDITEYFKYDDLSGDPAAGTVIARRFANSTAGKIGDARRAGKGENIKAEETVIQLDDSWEYINEVSEADIRTYGAEGLVERKALSNIQNARKDKAEKFWAVTVEAGTKFEPSANATTMAQKLDELIAAELEVKSKFTRGISRSKVGIALSQSAYGKLQGDIDLIRNHNNDNTYAYFHNVHVWPTEDLPDNVDVVIGLLKKTTAQPTIALTPIAGRAPFSNDYFFGTQGKYGTKCVFKEAVKYIENVSATSEE